MPSDAEVRAKMAKDLLAPENLLRKMMGLPEVDASTVIVETTFSVDGFAFDAGNGSGPVTLAASERAGGAARRVAHAHARVRR